MASVDVGFGFDIADPATWLPTIWNVGTAALGTEGPVKMVVANVLISVVAISASVVSLGATLLVLAITLPLIGIGFIWLLYRRVTG